MSMAKKELIFEKGKYQYTLAIDELKEKSDAYHVCLFT